jgi:predicted secreted protein
MAFVNGSDLLVKVAGAYVGHATTHTVNYNTETKDRTFKPVGTAAKTSGKWKDKAITGLSISISVESLICDDETEGARAKLLEAWAKGEPVEVEALERGDDTKPYLKGQFVITSMTETAPAEDDSTFSLNLDNSGKPETFEPKNLSDYGADE